MKMHVTKVGEKFTFHGKTFTVKSFFGQSGVEYDTPEQVVKNNSGGTRVLVKNQEFGGSTNLFDSIKVASN